jgi:tol-pal system protein YbgF
MRNGNRIPLKFLAAGVAAVRLSGCAPAPKRLAGDPSLPEIDVLQLKENSDEALKLSQENKLALQSLETKVRELESRISSLGDELANLPVAKLDELTQQMALMTEQLRLMEERLSRAPVQAAEKKMPTFSPTGLDTAAGKKPPTEAKKEDPAKPAPKPAKPAAKKIPATEVEAQMYKKAFDLYYGRDYGKAVDRFDELLAKFPLGAYADNCHYWIGECQFAQGNFAKAVTAFRKVFTFPETEKADDAQLKLGYCYLRLGDKRQAAEEFKKVVSLYPDSEYTERAKEELAKLE